MSDEDEWVWIEHPDVTTDETGPAKVSAVAFEETYAENGWKKVDPSKVPSEVPTEVQDTTSDAPASAEPPAGTSDQEVT